VDDRHKEKRHDLKGLFIYAASVTIGDDQYIATIKLDDTSSDNRAFFKDITIKKRPLYMGQAQSENPAYVDPPADRCSNLHLMVEFVKKAISENDKILEKQGRLCASPKNDSGLKSLDRFTDKLSVKVRIFQI
jgi:hypothetical protein